MFKLKKWTVFPILLFLNAAFATTYNLALVADSALSSTDVYSSNSNSYFASASFAVDGVVADCDTGANSGVCQSNW